MSDIGKQTSRPVEIPDTQIAINPSQLEFIRLPPVGQRCSITGLTRSALNELILPTPRNDNHPPVKSFCLRQRGAKTGIRLVDYQSLRSHIHANIVTQEQAA